jgi:hypothetical protein
VSQVDAEKYHCAACALQNRGSASWQANSAAIWLQRQPDGENAAKVASA